MKTFAFSSRVGNKKTGDILKTCAFCSRVGNKRLGDIMKTFAPFLKLYTDYVKNFDEAVKLVEYWNDKSPEFSKVLRSIQPVVRWWS